jgi:subtilisin family serine protease
MVGDDKPGRVLVVAAGNSGEIFDLEDGHFYGIHTEAHVASHGVTRVPIVQPGADDTIDGSGFVWVNFRPGDEVSVGLEGPDGSRWLSLTGPGDELGHNEDNLSAGVVNNLVNGKTSLTEETNGAVVFWDGEWENGEFAVLLEGRGDAQLWVTGTGQAGPSLFSTGLVFTRALRTGTVAVPASHQDLIAVGCTLNRSEWATVGGLLVSPKLEPALEDSMCDFSGAGPTPIGAMKPDLLAPGGFIAGAMSRDADPRSDPTSIFALPGCQEQTCALVDDTHAITQGTSMSAPQVAGAAALLLERDPQLTQRQVREVLQAGARRPTGIVPFDYQQGPGVLDMRGAVQVLDERSTGKLATVGKSFYVLGSPYLRPTPNWPVRGVVQLRLDDGSVAMGAAVRDLTIAIDNGGLVVEPLQQMRAGTFTFALGAPRGTAGRLVNVEVFYRGQSLGRRTLAVAVDRWRAGRDFTAVGGCSVSPRAGDPSLLLLLVLLAWTRGGRRLDGARGELRERSSSSGTC